MTVDVVTAVADPTVEAAVVRSLSGGAGGVRVVRRCVDLADLLAASAAGLGRVAVVSPHLRQLDREALTRLAVSGVAVVGALTPGDEPGRRRFRELGVGQVVTSDAHAADIAAVLTTAVATHRPERAAAGRDFAEPAAVLPAAGSPDGEHPASSSPPGQVVAVWGPTGGPGRSTVAVTLATELAQLVPTLLIDADVYGACAAQLLGLLDEAPGLAAACRQATAGGLDADRLAELAVELRPGCRVLTGIARSQRWPELRPSALETVLDLARSLAAVVVVDVGFSLEQDEELSYDTMAPRRNGATLAVLDAADVVVGVAAADPVGLQRYVRGLAELTEAVPGCSPVTVANRVRRGPTGPGDPKVAIRHALERYAGVTARHFVPEDRAALDAALAAGRTLTEVAPRSPARLAIRDLAVELAGVPVPGAGRRRASRRGPLRRARR